jgi:hypothetical protein
MKLLMITKFKTESWSFVGRAPPGAAGIARPTVNLSIVMNYVKLKSYFVPFVNQPLGDRFLVA